LFTTIIQFYYGSGDTTRFFVTMVDMQEGINYKGELLWEIYRDLGLNPQSELAPFFAYDLLKDNLGYQFTPSNYMIPKLALPLSYIFFNSYLSISLCFSFFAFAGTWRLYKTLYYMYPNIHKQLAIATLFLPSVAFWGSGFSKDSVCLGALGFFVYAVYSIFIAKKNIAGSIIALAFSGFLIYVIKIYILLAIVPALLLWIFFHYNHRIPDRHVRRLLSVFVLIATAGASVLMLQVLMSGGGAVDTSRYQAGQILDYTKSVQESYAMMAEGTSYFSLGEFDGSLGSFVRLFPQAVNAALFRPYLWDVRNPVMLLSALESTSLLYLTFLAFYKIGIKRFFGIIFSTPVIMSCFIFSVVFAGIVGINTYNFGTLARYKIPCLPFYLAMIFMIVEEAHRRKLIKYRMPDFWYRLFT
jgi:hypothetical protein